MKLSIILSLSGLLAVASAGYHTQYIEVVCTDPAPSTVTETVTVYAGCKEGDKWGNGNDYTPTTVHEPPYIATEPPYIVTAGPSVTSIDYHGSKTSVWVYPTGSPDNHDCVVAIYEDNTITVVIINISVTIINGYTTTITSTVHDRYPTWTPLPPHKTYAPQPPYKTNSTSYYPHPTGASPSGTDGGAKPTGWYPSKSSSYSSISPSYTPTGDSSISSSTSYSSTKSEYYPTGTGVSSLSYPTGSALYPKSSAVYYQRRGAAWAA